ncbi:MAG: glutamate-5-semialdehyde dehydrogenase [Bacillota bacterium]|jgi:glutamate-5-semialdehyde dehydrogenase
MKTITDIGKAAKKAAYKLAVATTEQKNQALLNMAEQLEKNYDDIMEANTLDMANAMAKDKPKAFLDRLMLTEARIKGMAKGLRDLVELPDPIGNIDDKWTAAEGIEITKIRVPLGVVGIIYEARPNVTADGAGICLKTGNAVILRGGSDAINSNLMVGRLLAKGIADAGLPAEAVQVVEDTSRETAGKMMILNRYISLLIPRGGKGLIQSVVQNATVPVIETGAGNCHVFVDSAANLKKAVDIIINAKTQRPAVCNAVESLLVAEERAEHSLLVIAEALRKAEVEIRGCERTVEVLSAQGFDVTPAADEDYYAEYGALILSCKVVKDVEAAIEHINQYGTHHSDCIITENEENAALFRAGVDSAAVYVNASTRFTDGEQFGFGAEIGISTQKLHARGPMGLNEMTSYKYLINGSGQIRK